MPPCWSWRGSGASSTSTTRSGRAARGASSSPSGGERRRAPPLPRQRAAAQPLLPGVPVAGERARADRRAGRRSPGGSTRARPPARCCWASPHAPRSSIASSTGRDAVVRLPFDSPDVGEFLARLDARPRAAGAHPAHQRPAGRAPPRLAVPAGDGVQRRSGLPPTEQMAARRKRLAELARLTLEGGDARGGPGAVSAAVLTGAQVGTRAATSSASASAAVSPGDSIP